MLSDLETLNKVKAEPQIERLRQISRTEVCLGYEKAAPRHVLTVYSETLRDTAAAPFCGPNSSPTAYVDDTLWQHPREQVFDHYIYERACRSTGAGIDKIEKLIVVLVGHTLMTTRPGNCQITETTIPQIRAKYCLVPRAEGTSRTASGSR